MIAESVPQARQMLESSLAARLPSPVSLGVVAGILAVAIAASLLRARHRVAATGEGAS